MPKRKDNRYFIKILWVIVILLVISRITFFVTRCRENELFLSVDDYARYDPSVHFLHTGHIGPYRRWLPLPAIPNAIILYLFSNRFGIADFWFILATNWIWFFLTLLVLTTGLFSRRDTTEKRRDLFSAIAFLSVVFVHQLSISTLSEPFQYFLIITFIYAMGNAWRKGNRVWRGLAVVSAMAWMSTRYEAWVTAGLIIFVSAIIASRNKKWEYPFLEPIIISIVPIGWAIYTYICWSDSLDFLHPRGLCPTKYSPGLWKSFLFDITKNGFLSIIAVPIFLRDILVEIFRKAKKEDDKRYYGYIEIFSLATGLILLGIVCGIFRINLLGHALPERFFYQGIIALCPFTGGVLSRALTFLNFKQKLGNAMGVILAILVLGWIHLFQTPKITLLPHHMEYYKIAQISQKNNLSLVVFRSPTLHSAHIGRWVFPFFYSWRKVETVVSSEPADISRLSDNGQKAVVVIKGGKMKIKNVPPHLRCFETFSLIVFFPGRTTIEGVLPNCPGSNKSPHYNTATK